MILFSAFFMITMCYTPILYYRNSIVESDLDDWDLTPEFNEDIVQIVK